MNVEDVVGFYEPDSFLCLSLCPAVFRARSVSKGVCFPSSKLVDNAQEDESRMM
jgi:hypothetical protein